MNDDQRETYPDVHIPYLSEISDKIVTYIAGFVVAKLKKKLHCEECIAALTTAERVSAHSLVGIKNRGGLTFPSSSVIKICQICERKFRTRVTLGSHNSHNKTMYCDKQALVHAVFVNCQNVFPDLVPHMTDTDPLTNHTFLLVKAVSEAYLDVRYHYAGKRHTHGVQSKKKLQKSADTQ